jgi:hypothetical protein
MEHLMSQLNFRESPRTKIDQAEQFHVFIFPESRQLLPEGAARERPHPKLFMLACKQTDCDARRLVEALPCRSRFYNKEFEDAGVPFEKDIVPFIPESGALTPMKKALQQY